MVGVEVRDEEIRAVEIDLQLVQALPIERRGIRGG